MAQQTVNISCEAVRAYVAQVGVAQAEAMALSGGMTPAQERLARPENIYGTESILLSYPMNLSHALVAKRVFVSSTRGSFSR
jgi:hypothetical protein